jgi:hypothetical protein
MDESERERTLVRNAAASFFSAVVWRLYTLFFGIVCISFRDFAVYLSTSSNTTYVHWAQEEEREEEVTKRNKIMWSSF